MVSVIMPAYNACRYIEDAIESVLLQTYQDWELIIVDDKSTDNTYDIISKYVKRDNRIKAFQLETNSGSAQRPRLTAEEKAQGTFLCMLDADDVLEPNYVEKLLRRQRETGADAVICRLCNMTEAGEKQAPWNPSEKIDMDTIISGREAFALTVGSWEINGVGLFKKEISEVALRRCRLLDSFNADEVFTRLKFLSCNIVAFCEADYYYRINLNSITRKFSIKIFDSLDVLNNIKSLALEEFGRNSEVYRRAVSSYFSAILRCVSLFHKNMSYIAPADRIKLKEKLRDNWNQLTLLEVFKISLLYGVIYSCGFQIYFAYISVRRKISKTVL